MYSTVGAYGDTPLHHAHAITVLIVPAWSIESGGDAQLPLITPIAIRNYLFIRLGMTLGSLSRSLTKNRIGVPKKPYCARS
jgi:hypothetical protein